MWTGSHANSCNLKLKAQTELQDPRRLGALNLAKERTGDIHVGRIESNLIQRVKELRAELQLGPLGDVKGLEQ